MTSSIFLLSAPQGSLGSKKYKFVVTGHGKYEKIPVDDDDTGGEFTNGKSGMNMKFVEQFLFRI